MIRGYVFIISAAILWGLIGIFSCLAFAEGLGPMEVAFWRAVITWFCFGAQAAVKKELGFDKKDFPLAAVFAFLGVSVFYISYQLAVKSGGAALASVLLYTAPAWVVVCSFFIYKERLTALKITAVISVILGVYLISKSGAGSTGERSIGLAAILWGLTSGFCYSLYYTIGKYFSKKYSGANLFVWVLPMGALGILPFVDFVPKSGTAWMILILVSIFSTFLANQCYYQGLKHLEAGRASIVATLEPVVAAVTAYILFGEAFTLLGYGGAGLILAAVLLTIYKE